MNDALRALSWYRMEQARRCVNFTPARTIINIGLAGAFFPTALPQPPAAGS